MHNSIYGNAPDYIKDWILSVSDVHNVYTRSFSSGDLYGQTVKYLNNHFYTTVLQYGTLYQAL